MAATETLVSALVTLHIVLDLLDNASATKLHPGLPLGGAVDHPHS